MNYQLVNSIVYSSFHVIPKYFSFPLKDHRIGSIFWMNGLHHSHYTRCFFPSSLALSSRITHRFATPITSAQSVLHVNTKAAVMEKKIPMSFIEFKKKQCEQKELLNWEEYSAKYKDLVKNTPQQSAADLLADAYEDYMYLNYKDYLVDQGFEPRINPFIL